MNNGSLDSMHYTVLLTTWVKKVIENQLWEKYADLHIDMLDLQFKQPGRWVETSFFLLPCLQNIIDKSKYEVLLAIPLASSDNPINTDILQISRLEKSVDATPPSFYLYPIGFAAFAETIDTSLFLPLLSRAMGHEVYFREAKDEDGYNNTLFVR